MLKGLMIVQIELNLSTAMAQIVTANLYRAAIS